MEKSKQQNAGVRLSIIIPCKNEEEVIGKCLDSIITNRSNDSRFEIIVVDNGSTDHTLEILYTFREHISLYEFKVGTISELRNFGASKASGEWLAFIDADVVVGENWYKSVFQAIEFYMKLGENEKRIITGSTYGLYKSPTWIERTWHNYLIRRQKRSVRYINGGNLIIHSEFFKIIGGFHPLYQTGEDEKLCRDAVQHGGTIQNERSIQAYHLGYPKTLQQFAKREFWHGRALIRYVKKPWSDRALMLAIYNIVCLASFIILALCSSIHLPLLLIFIVTMLILPLCILAMTSIGRCSFEVLKLTLLFFVYGAAKSAALIGSIWQEAAKLSVWKRKAGPS